MLVLDEIQKISGWSDTVKGLWDADRASGCPLHVVILGSSPLLMQRGLNETLAGRFEPIRFTHWSYAEMSEAFGLGVDQRHPQTVSCSTIRGRPEVTVPGSFGRQSRNSRRMSFIISTRWNLSVGDVSNSGIAWR